MHINTQTNDQPTDLQVHGGTQGKKEGRVRLFFLVLLSCVILGFVFSSDSHSTLDPSQARVLQFDDDYLVRRVEYGVLRRKYLKGKDGYPSLKLIESNLDIREQPDADLAAAQESDYARLDEIHHFSDFKKELPFCIIVQSLNFTVPYLFQYTLNSIFAQNYSNYKAVIFNFDESGHENIIDYFKLHKIRKENYVFIKNREYKNIIENIGTASLSHCQKGSISLNIVDNNELIGKNVLKVFNAVYQANKVGMVYSNFYTYNQGFSINLGFNIEHSNDELLNIRKLRFALSTSVTYLTQHFLKINATDLKDSNGKYLDLAYEQAIFFPITEIACRKVMKIDGFHVLVKSGVRNFEEFKKSLILKGETSLVTRNRKAYACDESFNSELKHKVMIHHRSYLTEEPTLKAISEKRVQKRGIVKEAKAAKNFYVPEGGSQKLGEYLYKDDKVLKEREEFQRERINLINLMDREDSKKMIKANLKLGEYSDNLQQKQEEYQLFEAQSIHKITRYSEELPFCIIVEELQFQQIFRFQHMLNSIFNQNYTNFFAVIINKNIKMDEVIRRYLSFYRVNKSRYVYIENYEERSRIEMLYNAMVHHCSFDSMAIVDDGSGELLGKNTLKIYNRYFMEYNAGFIYSNNYLYTQSQANLHYSSTDKYTQEERSKNKYRYNKKYGHLMAFRTELFYSIDAEDFQDVDGKFHDGSFDNHMYTSILELSCKNIHKILGVHYVEHQDIKKAKPEKDMSRLVDEKRYECGKDKKLRMRASLLEIEALPELVAISAKHVQRATEATGSEPLDLLMVNEQGEGIEQYLYKDERRIIAKRSSYQMERINYFKKQKSDDSRQLIPFNLKLDSSYVQEQGRLQRQEFEQIKKMYGNIQGSKQFPICVIVDRFNFQIPYKFQYTLNSIFTQNYTNYFVVIFNDGSKEGNYLLRKYLYFYKIASSRFAFLENKEKRQSLELTELAINNYCGKDSLVMSIAGEDQLIGKNVFKIFSHVHQTEKTLVQYSNYYSYNQGVSLDYGRTSFYTKQQLEKGSYRELESKYGYPIFYHSQLFRKISKNDLKFQNNEYYKHAFQRAIMVPMLELSCGRVKKMNGVHYLYNSNRGISIDRSLQAKEAMKIRSSTKYACPQSKK